jgi:hypothetical protein
MRANSIGVIVNAARRRAPSRARTHARVGLLMR